MLGTIIVVVVYMLYYIGISGSIKTEELLPNGASLAFKTIFGNVAGTILTVFIAVSCLGTLNGLTLACDRGFYSLAARNHGPRPDFLGKLDHATEMPSNASIVALIFNALWLFYFYMANLTDFASYTGKGSIFLFDSTELPLICVYAFYPPLCNAHGQGQRSQRIPPLHHADPFVRRLLPLYLCGYRKARHKEYRLRRYRTCHHGHRRCLL